MTLKDVLTTVSYHQTVEIIYGDKTISGQYDNIKGLIPIELFNGVVKDVAACQDSLKIWLDVK